MSEERQKKGISRRTVVKGAAWAVPAVPIVVATPAYASSPQCFELTLGAKACKWSGNPQKYSYSLEICFYNSCGGTYPLWIDYLQNNSGKLMTACGTPNFSDPNPLTLRPGENCFGPFEYSAIDGSSAGTIEVYGWIGVKGAPGTATMLGDFKTSGTVVLDECLFDNPCLSLPPID